MQIHEMVRKHQEIPRMDETNHRPEGPMFAAIRRRTLFLYAVMCVAGVLPGVLALSGVPLSPKVCACAMGLFVPGGGFLACADPTGIALGCTFMALFALIGFKLLDMFGWILTLLLLWAGGMLGGLGVCQFTWLSLFLPILGACGLWGYYAWQTHLLYRNQRVELTKRTAQFEAMQKTFESVDAMDTPQHGTRELDEQGMAGMRYLLSVTLREPGDFNCFDKFIPSSTSSYRYQFAMLGYALAVLQCNYMPNFHGYLSQAQRFLIESYTDPRVCAYWKWENLGGYLKWNADPVKKANVMLSGWAMAAMMMYESNTGDKRYEKADALAFHPYYHSNKSYSYSFRELIEVFEKQWNHEKGVLFPCEPNIVFPVCNSYAIIAGLIYDRLYGTDYATRHYEDFIHSLEQEYCDMDGLITIRKHLLTGLRFTPPTNPNGSAINNIAIAQEYLPIHPGLAKRCYALARHELIEIRNDGAAYIKGMPWEEAYDFGTMHKNPGLFISNILMAAAEFGDRELVEALQKTQELYLRRHKNKQVLKFKDVSVCGMANLALGSFCKKNDWSKTILQGPAQTAFIGPLLAECPYPQALVTSAHSDGSDLRLVLHGNTSVILGLERLKPHHNYRVQNTTIAFTASAEGKASFAVLLKGRTPIRVVPEE